MKNLKALKVADIRAGNKVDITKELDFKNGNIIRLSNKTNLYKKPDCKNDIVNRVSNKTNTGF